MKYYLIALAGMGCLTFLAFGWDKRQATLDRPRVPEKTLHALELCGGWLGSLAGQRTFHHKTRKVSYQFNFWLIVGMHVAAASLYLWYKCFKTY